MAATARVPDDDGTGQEPTRCDHRMRVVGYVHGSAGVRTLRRRSVRLAEMPGVTGCESPLLAGCEHCDQLRIWACANHRESRCRPCAFRYRRRVARLAGDGLEAHQNRAGSSTYLLTLTAPSWRAHNRYIPGRRGRHGTCWTCPGAHPDGLHLERWNGLESAAWNRLCTRLRREGLLAFMGAVEVQRRGALHRHVLLVLDRPADVGRLHEWATAAGYGCDLDLEPLIPGSRKYSRYVAKYVTKSCDARGRVPWLRVKLDRWTGELVDKTDATFRTWSSSQSWGLTMRELVAASRSAVMGDPAVAVPWLRPVEIPAVMADSG